MLTKETKLTYHNERSCLNNVVYQVKKIGTKNVTLEPIHGQKALIGLPTFRQPFNVAINDLTEGIKEGTYTTD